MIHFLHSLIDSLREEVFATNSIRSEYLRSIFARHQNANDDLI